MIPFRKRVDWVRALFVRKEKPFSRGKVRHKIADFLETGYALPYCQRVKACVGKVLLEAPRMELSGFYKGKKFLLGVGNAIVHIIFLQGMFRSRYALFWHIESQRQGDT